MWGSKGHCGYSIQHLMFCVELTVPSCADVDCLIHTMPSLGFISWGVQWNPLLGWRKLSKFWYFWAAKFFFVWGEAQISDGILYVWVAIKHMAKFGDEWPSDKKRKEKKADRKVKVKVEHLYSAPSKDTATSEALRYMACTKQRRTYLPYTFPAIAGTHLPTPRGCRVE